MQDDPLIVWFTLLVLYAALVTGAWIGTLLLRRCRCAGACQSIQVFDDRPHGDVPYLPPWWPGKVRAAKPKRERVRA